MPRHLTTDDTAAFVTSAQLGAVNGVAVLGADGKVPNSQLPAVATGSVDSVNGQVGNVELDAANVGAVPVAEKGAANGVAQLDSTGHVVTTQLPTGVLMSSQLAQPSGIATLDALGKLPAAQLNAPVTSVNTKTGAVSLTAADVSALATSTRGAPNGVAQLDGSGLVPLGQIPSLAQYYQAVPGSTATKPGQQLAAVAAGSNSTVWADPLVYVASSIGTMPTPGTVPIGALCIRTDTKVLYTAISGTWIAIPFVEPWRTLSMPNGVRGYNNNDPEWVPQVRRIGAQVFIRGRVELTSGAIIPNQQVLVTLPSDCVPSDAVDLVGTSTTGANQPGIARYQIDASTNQVKFFAGGGPTPSSSWLGIQGSYWVD